VDQISRKSRKLEKNNGIQTSTILVLPDTEVKNTYSLVPDKDQQAIQSYLIKWNIEATNFGCCKELIESISKIIPLKESSPALEFSLYNLKQLATEKIQEESTNNQNSLQKIITPISTTSFFTEISNNIYSIVLGNLRTSCQIISNYFNSALKFLGELLYLKEAKNIRFTEDIIEPLFTPNTNLCFKPDEKKPTDEKEHYTELIKRIDSFFFLNKPYLSRNILDHSDPRDGIKNNQPKIIKS